MATELELMQTRLLQLEQTNTDIQADNADIKTQFQQAEGRYVLAQRRLRIQAALAFVAFFAASFLSPGNRAAIAQGYGITLAILNTRLNAVEAKTQYLSVNTTAKSSTFSGCNVFVNDGGGSTGTIVKNAAGDGLGNLTIGYNDLRHNLHSLDPRANLTDIRIGSHNLIVGDYNNYNSIGGVVIGYYNSNIAPYATITGGNGNTASGYSSSVSGGDSNTASGSLASVSGGFNNSAGGFYSSVSGGLNNTINGFFTAVSGGNGVIQNNDVGWAAGGTGAGTYHSP